jgi:hypothetical protein
VGRANPAMANGLAAIKHEKIGVARLKTLDKNSKSSERRGNDLKDAPTLEIKGSEDINAMRNNRWTRGFLTEKQSLGPATAHGRKGSDRANG